MINLMTENAANIEARTNLIWMMTSDTENLKARNTIKRKSVGNLQNRTCQTHRQATIIHPTRVTINVRNSIIRIAIGKRNGGLSNYAQSYQKKL